MRPTSKGIVPDNTLKAKRMNDSTPTDPVVREIREGFHKMAQPDAVRLLSASEVAEILHTCRNTVYNLFRQGLLDFWNINGFRMTNIMAICDFLDRTKNVDQMIEKEDKNERDKLSQ